MDKQFVFTNKLKYISIALIVIGLAAFVIGIFTHTDRMWASLLVNNYYFLTVVIGATFFGALQYITHSGWSAGFVRVHQSMSNFIPVIFVLMIPIMFGLHEIYHWSHHDALEDPLIAHKSPYLNVPFFVGRYILFFVLWILLTQMLFKMSLNEDKVGGLKNFNKMEFYSKVYIFVLAVTFSLSSFDWIMSIDVHWYSTIFAVRNFAMAFYHGTVVVTLVVILMNKAGYFPYLNQHHLRDFSKYIFILSIIWAYTWFSQYILIWYANIPEETIYYVPRTKGEFTPFFYLELVINWLIPFLVLLSSRIGSRKDVLITVAILLIIGQWIDVYQQVYPGTIHHVKIGFIEIGSFLGFTGLFIYALGYTFKRTPLVPKNHPYLNESIKHH